MIISIIIRVITSTRNTIGRVKCGPGDPAAKKFIDLIFLKNATPLIISEKTHNAFPAAYSSEYTVYFDVSSHKNRAISTKRALGTA